MTCTVTPLHSTACLSPHQTLAVTSAGPVHDALLSRPSVKSPAGPASLPVVTPTPSDWPILCPVGGWCGVKLLNRSINQSTNPTPSDVPLQRPSPVTTTRLLFQEWGCNAPKPLWSSRLPIPIRSWFLLTFYRFIVKRLRPLFVGGAIQIYIDWLIDPPTNLWTFQTWKFHHELSVRGQWNFVFSSISIDTTK